MRSISALKRIQRLQKLTPPGAGQTHIHQAEAAILQDMLHAARPEAIPMLDFIVNYLPKTLPEPRGACGRLIGEDSELDALQQRIRRDALGAALWKRLLDAARRHSARESPERIDWREQKRPLWRERGGHWLLAAQGLQCLAWAGRLGRIREYEHNAK